MAKIQNVPNDKNIIRKSQLVKQSKFPLQAFVVLRLFGFVRKSHLGDGVVAKASEEFEVGAGFGDFQLIVVFFIDFDFGQDKASGKAPIIL